MVYKWCVNGLQIVDMVGAWSREEPRRLFVCLDSGSLTTLLLPRAAANAMWHYDLACYEVKAPSAGAHMQYGRPVRF